MKFYTKKTKDMSDKDKQSIVTLFNEVFSKKRTLEEFHDQFELNELGYSYFGIMEDDLGNIVGSYAVMPINYRYFGKEFIFGQSVDTMIKKEFRGNAFNLRKIANSVYNSLIEDKIPFVFGFPNNQIYLIRKKLLKWKDIGTLDTYISPLYLGKFSILSPINTIFLKILSLFNSLLNRIFFIKNKKKYLIIKNTFSGNEKYRNNNYSNTIKLNDNTLIHYFNYHYKKFNISFFIDLELLNIRNFNEAINTISQNEKKSNMIIYVGKLNFRPLKMVRLPKFIKNKNMRLCGKILIPELIDQEIFNEKNWQLNLSNTDLT